jgi:hypothetical protein
MNLLKGLYFPGASPDKELFRTLLCLLDKVVYYQIGAEGEAFASASEAADWEGQAVLPPGEERDRFLAMIRDIKIHAADYYSGFLAGLAADSLVDRSEASVWQLVAGMHGKSRELGQDPVVTEKLWQARLVLKLAEILAEEQADLANGLAEFERQEQAVYVALKGEIDDPAEVDEIFQPPPGLGGDRAVVSVRHLLKAWGTLFVTDPRDHPFLVTGSEEAAAIFFADWQELSGARPRLLLDVALPFLADAPAAAKVRTELAAAGAPIRRALQAVLAGDEAAGVAELETGAALWQSQVAAYAGRKSHLRIYLLPVHSLWAVWGRLSRWPGPVAPKEGGRPALVAVLGPAA